MEVVVAQRVALLCAGPRTVAGDGVTGAREPRVALDVHVQQVARARPLIAADLTPRRPRGTRASVASQDRADRRVRDPRLSDEQPWPPARSLACLADTALHVCGRLTRTAVRAA